MGYVCMCAYVDVCMRGCVHAWMCACVDVGMCDMCMCGCVWVFVGVSSERMGKFIVPKSNAPVL